MANTQVDNYIDTLKIGSEVQYYWFIYTILSYDTYWCKVIEKDELNPEEIMDLTWSDISEEIELLNLEIK